MSETAPDRVVQRVLSRIEVAANGCWIWPGATSGGYGRIAWTTDGGRKTWGAVHRALYADEHGPIPDGLDIDHTCHDPATCHPERAEDCPHRRCCNPAHLRAVSRRQNLLRGGTVAAERAAVTHCPRGHAYEGENLMHDRHGRRSCRACAYEKNRAYYWANRERRKAYNKALRAQKKEQS